MRTLSAEGEHCATLGIPLPSASLLALPRRFVRSGIQGGQGDSASNKVCAEIPMRRRENTPHAEGSFFLYEKSVLRESDSLRGRKPEVCTDLTPPFSALKKALEIMGIQGESLPDAPPAAHLRIRRSRIPRCVVKRRTAETRDSVSRPCPSAHAESPYRTAPTTISSIS